MTGWLISTILLEINRLEWEAQFSSA